MRELKIKLSNAWKERLKSIPLWAAVLSLTYLVLKNVFKIEIPDWADTSSSILAILAVLFGVSNNPTDRENF